MRWGERDLALSLAVGQRLASQIGHRIDHVIPEARHGLQEDQGPDSRRTRARWSVGDRGLAAQWRLARLLRAAHYCSALNASVRAGARLTLARDEQGERPASSDVLALGAKRSSPRRTADRARPGRTTIYV
jgi:hypothetical protein